MRLEWDFDYCMSTNVPYNTSGASAVQFAEITAYAPETFEDLRARFGIPEEDFRQSILHSGPYVSFQSNSKGAARAGKCHVEVLPRSLPADAQSVAHSYSHLMFERWCILLYERWSVYDQDNQGKFLVARCLLLDRQLLTLTLIIVFPNQKQEAQTLLKMLPKYHKYMKRNGHRSLLTRFCGMYGVSLGTSGASTMR